MVHKKCLLKKTVCRMCTTVSLLKGRVRRGVCAFLSLGFRVFALTFF